MKNQSSNKFKKLGILTIEFARLNSKIANRIYLNKPITPKMKADQTRLRNQIDKFLENYG